uniref:Uncharacterized protein n=1 Tax=Setaria italica TaxID=4555 RepID=K3ZW25_SETIT
MSTAVAEVRPAYGFPGSGKRSAGEQAAVLAAGKRRSDGFFIEEDEAEEEVLTETSSLGAPSPSGSSIGENSSSEAGGEDGEEEEVESKLKEGDALGCLDALEDSLPIKASPASTPASPSPSPASPRPRRRWRRPRSWPSRRTPSTSAAASWPTGLGEPPAARSPRPPTSPRSWPPTTPSPRGTRAKRTTPTTTRRNATSCRTAARTSGVRRHCHCLRRGSSVLACRGGMALGASDPLGPSHCPICKIAGLMVVISSCKFAPHFGPSFGQ